jgi:6-pyruvoyltetrahydropterin/6-carboxytetrahydropterin synthase
LSFKLIFGCTELDGRNWVLDFGGLKSVKQFLSDTFDHKMLVAEDDPYLEELLELNDVGLAQVITVPAVGCEGFAKLVFDFVEKVLDAEGHVPRVWLHSAECREHEGNSAIYEREYPEGT